MRLAVLIAAGLSAASPLMAQVSLSPHAGQEHRPIKALSPEDMRDLREGRGMGLAKTAELNGYPGPLHVLELAGELNLTAEQRSATEALYQRMLSEAKRLGAAILQAEGDLERRFQHRHIDQTSLQAATSTIADLQGKLRAVHLATHLEQAALLTQVQIAEYTRRRGYESADGAGHRGHNKH